VAQRCETTRAAGRSGFSGVMAMKTMQLTLDSGLPADILTAGTGPALLYLHNHLGRDWDAFLEALAETHTVYAPRHPGSDEPDELLSLDGFADLALYYDDLLNALEVDSAVVVGHGFGGMAAAEFAAHCPARVSRLVLIDSLGLWLDETPIEDISGVPAERVASILSGSSEVTGALLAQPEDPAAIPDFMVGRFLSQAAVSHFIWPIPDRDLRRRLYRIVMPTLVLWGEDDQYVPAQYAHEFEQGLPNAQLKMIAGAGHMPQLEKADQVMAVLNDFLSTV
jgi:pimeloyl-ACP methyl ester carboxylesterase